MTGSQRGHVECLASDLAGVTGQTIAFASWRNLRTVLDDDELAPRLGASRTAEVAQKHKVLADATDPASAVPLDPSSRRRPPSDLTGGLPRAGGGPPRLCKGTDGKRLYVPRSEVDSADRCWSKDLHPA